MEIPSKLETPLLKFIIGENNTPIISSYLVSFQCEFDRNLYDISQYKTANITFPESLRCAVIKRQSEFLAGRYAAKQAINFLGCTDSQIPIGPQRNPLWPNGIVGSISHTNTQAICLVGLREHVDYVGVDIENWLSRETAKEIADTLVTKRELSNIAELHIDEEKVLTIIFSAKESLFKAIYPAVGEYFDFDAVELQSLCLRTMKIVLRLEHSLSLTVTKDMIFEGHIFIEDEKVTTYFFGQL